MKSTIKTGILAFFCFGSSLLYAGATPSNDPHANSPCDTSDPGDCSSSSGMPIYSFKSMLAGLSLRDTPLSYTPPVGPSIEFILYYNEKDNDQSAVFSGGNFGQKWTSNWLTFIQDDPNSVGNKVLRYVAGGGAQQYSGYQSSTGEFNPQHGNAAVLVRLDSQSYELRKNDGSIERFALAEDKNSYPRKVYLTERIDPQGNVVRLSYDASMRLKTITDAIGQVSHFYYNNPDFPLVVTRMEDPFGRSSQIEYDTQGRLSAITDAIGLRSSFTYQGASYFINSMTTPYGTTTFEKTQGLHGSSSASIQAIDPLGHIERTEYRHSAPGIGYSESQVPAGMGMLNNYLNYRNSFYWNKTAFSQACNRENSSTICDYTQAQIKHFLHNKKGQTARTLESIKKPLESRVWFNYAGQSNTIYTGTFGKPKQIGRVLSDGTTQLFEYQYNAQGNITVSVDPDGRTTYYHYADNGIDLIQIQQKNGQQIDTLWSAIYNESHLPIQVTNAAGQSQYYFYNDRGQRTKITNALGHTIQFVYDASGYLSYISNALGRVQQRFDYDAFGRVSSITDSKGYTLRYQYDALNRLTSIIYPDNSKKTFVWDKLDLASVTDREGKITTYEYDANRNLIKETNPLGQSIRYSYYPNGDLHRLIDTSGNITTWERDIQGRVIQKRYADYKGDEFSYDLAGRLEQKKDALGQIVQYRYSRANLLQEKRYIGSHNPTADVLIEYDAAYPRPNKVIDGQGTTLYQYYLVGELGAHQLKTIQGEQVWQNWQFSYDALGREVSKNIANGLTTQQYDALGRVVTHNNSLGQFNYGYLGDSQQVVQQKITDIPYQWQREYYGNSDDRQLKNAQYQQLETIQKQWPWPLNLVLPAPAPEIKTHSLLNYDFGYSVEGRLTERTTATTEQWQSHHHLHFPILHWLLGIHHGQHTQTQTINGTEQFSYDDNGRLISVHKQRQKTGEYYYDPMGNITDMEESGFAYQQNYNELNQAQTHEYDANGNLINDGQFAYTWDAENRLIKIKNHETSTVSEFVYDAYSRRISETMTDASGQSHTIYNLWCGETLCAQANEQGQITHRYFGQGEWHNGQAYFYAQDQIGSVTAMIDTQGKVAGTALYSPYGKLLQSQGVQANIAYAGLYHHKESGLYLATYRGYNPFTARWLNRDPIEENGGLNLYEYVGGNPINSIDPLGLWSASIKVHAGLGGSLTLGWSPSNGIFGSLQGGIGLDAGVSFDPLDNGPFDRELRKGPYAEVCPNLNTGKRGVSLGTNINIGVSAYGYGIEYGAAGGRHFLDGTSASYSEQPSLKFGTNVLESSIGFSAGGSANVEITLW